MATTRDNVVSLAYGMRKRICQNIGIHLNVFARAIKELVDREILKNTENKDYFILNPHIFLDKVALLMWKDCDIV